MLITREIDYALRILRHLQHGMASAAEIEKTQQVSADFSRKILRKLKKAGIVEAVRGSREDTSFLCLVTILHYGM